MARRACSAPLQGTGGWDATVFSSRCAYRFIRSTIARDPPGSKCIRRVGECVSEGFVIAGLDVIALPFCPSHGRPKLPGWHAACRQRGTHYTCGRLNTCGRLSPDRSAVQTASGFCSLALPSSWSTISGRSCKSLARRENPDDLPTVTSVNSSSLAPARASRSTSTARFISNGSRLRLP